MMILVKRFSMVILFLWAVVWSNCASTKVVEIPAKTVTHRYSYGQPRPLGEGKRHYQADMVYDSRKGVLRIISLDHNENPVKLLREERIKASLTGPDGKVHDFYFSYPWPPIWYFNSYRVVGHRQPPVDHYSIEEDWLKGLSSLKLKVWIPLGNTIYIVEFLYP